jgi:hypothetical protein
VPDPLATEAANDRTHVLAMKHFDYSLFKEHSVATMISRWPTTAFSEKRLQPLTADAFVIQTQTPQPPRQDCVPRIGVANNIAISSTVNRCQEKSF